MQRVNTTDGSLAPVPQFPLSGLLIVHLPFALLVLLLLEHLVFGPTHLTVTDRPPEHTFAVVDAAIDAAFYVAACPWNVEQWSSL